MNRLLSKLGLMRVSEHEANVSQLEFRLETYGNTLRNRTKALDTCEDQNEKLEAMIADLQDELADLRPDALTYRRKLARDAQVKRDRRANNRKGKVTRHCDDCGFSTTDSDIITCPDARCRGSVG